MSRTVYKGVTTNYVGAKMKLNLEDILKGGNPTMKKAEEKMIPCVVCSKETNMMLNCGHFICSNCHSETFNFENAVPVKQNNGDIYMLNICPKCDTCVTSSTSQFL